MSKFRILSLDGGGIRGAFSASFLAELEREVGGPLGAYFDLIVGTSTGGIIATALALGESAVRIEQLYIDHGKQIFTRQAPNRGAVEHWLARSMLSIFDGRLNRRLSKVGLDVDYLLQCKYDAAALRAILEGVFGAQTLGDAPTRLALPVVDLAAGKVVVMKTPHLPHSTRDLHYRAVDAVLSTTAAPSYFPHATITDGSAYCDGGLWANNPTLIGYAEAMKIRERCRRPNVDPTFEPHEIWVLSVGTGYTNYSLAPPKNSAGLAWWAPRLIDTTLLSQAQGTETLAQYLIGSPRHHRVNFALPDASWTLDCVDHLAALRHHGYSAAHVELAKVRKHFLYGFADPYLPF